MIDRFEFPRDKLCGGLLTLRSKKVFDRVFRTTWDEIVDAVFRGIDVFYRDEALAEVRDYSALFATQRYRFDNFLLNLAREKGAILLTNLRVKHVDVRSNSITMSDGSTMTFGHLIGADGVKSIVARCLFGQPLDLRTIGFGLELNASLLDFARIPTVPEVHLGAVRWGYGWVFPKGSHAVIGVGGLHKKNPDLMKQFREFLKRRCGHVPTKQIRGHFLPYGDFRAVPGSGNVLLVGDASGLVDSLSGEGIAFAMQSGNAAALSILDCSSGHDLRSALDRYRDHYREITRIISLSNRYRPLVFLPIFERVFARTLIGAEAIQRGYLDIFADELEYDRLPGLIVRQIYKGVLKVPKALAGR